MEVLAFVLDRGPVSLRDAAEHFSGPPGLARTTIHTVLERLRTKGYLVRERVDDVLQYSAAVERKTLLNGLITQFVSARLGGSVSPLVAYLGEANDLSEAEIQELRAVVNKLGEKS